ncbi:MAG: hypothetical protein AB8E82_19670 [Aureispira sp.]
MYQYDLSIPIDSIITAAAYLLKRDRRINDIRLGPDAKIYHSQNDSTYLNAIAAPNNKGAAANYQVRVVDLAFGKNTITLPDMLSQQLLPVPLSSLAGATRICQRNTAEIYRVVQEDCSGIQRVSWQHRVVNTVSNATDSTIAS